MKFSNENLHELFAAISFISVGCVLTLLSSMAIVIEVYPQGFVGLFLSIICLIMGKLHLNKIND